MNVGYADLNTADVATLLGVDHSSVAIWCKKGFIKYTNIGNGNKRPRYMFDEVERVRKLIEKYGKRNWITYSKETEPAKTEPKTAIIPVTINPDEYIVDDTDETIDYIKKIRALKIQRDKLLVELDNIDDAIKTMRQKVIESI